MDSKERQLSWRVIVIVLAVLALVAGALALMSSSSGASNGQIRTAEWQEEVSGTYAIKLGRRKIFHFDGRSDRVLVADTPEFNFGTNQDFSVEAWIKAYPPYSRLAMRLQVWLQTHPAMASYVPRSIGSWITTHALDNDFGVMPIVDKHQTPSTIESVGFEFYLDHGKLACQISQSPMRQLGFQNFISSAPTLQDGHWHHVAMTVKRTSVTGGKLYVDSLQVFVFDPTAQAGDLSNSNPLRIGNHSNPNLRCFFKGAISGVALHREAVAADEIAASYRAGRPE
jgi:hypothetical protein